MNLTKWSNTTKTWVLIGLAVLLLLALYALRALLPPLALAVVLAYLLKPLVDILDRRAHIPRVWATLIVFVVVLLVFSAVAVTIVPAVGKQVGLLGPVLEDLLRDLQAWLEKTSFLSRSFHVLNFEIQLEDLIGNLQGELQNLLKPFFTQTVGLLVSIASSLLWVVTILLTAFWMVKDAQSLRSFLDRVAPKSYVSELRQLREAVSAVWRQFFRGQLVLGLVIGIAVGLCTTIVGLPNAGLMGLLAGLLEAVPNFGPIIAAIPAVLTALLRGSSWLSMSHLWFGVLVVGIYVVIQQLENNILVPRIMGGRLQLHPVVVMIGILAGGILFGVVGVFLAAPVVGSLAVLLRYIHAKLLDRDPFPVSTRPGQEEFDSTKIDAILFDLDGTLADTDDAAVTAIARRLARLRRILPSRDPQLAARKLVMSLDRPVTRILGLLNRLHLDDNIAGLANHLYRLRAVRPAAALSPVQGVVEMLPRLAGKYKLAIVTNRSRREAEAFLVQQGLAELFATVSGREDTWHMKPHPAPVLHAASDVGVPPTRCLMVGDTAADVLSARQAGARTAGVLCGFGTRRLLEEAHADLILATTSLLPAQL